MSDRTAVLDRPGGTAVGGPPVRRVWAWVRLLGGVALLAVLVWRVGTGPFRAGLRVVDAPALAVAGGIGAVTTVCCAWRWRMVAAGLGVRLPLGGAVAAYYRAQLLNVTLPGGILGDVHRAVRHGRDIGDVGLGARAVVLERLSAQPVHVAAAFVVLLVFPSPVPRYVPIVLLAAVVVAVVVARRGVGPAGGMLRAIRADVHAGLVAGGAWVGILAASTVVLAGHLVTFLVAARAVGADAPLARLVPLALLALLAMVLPINVAGWGPREGVAAWAFGAAGLTAAQGVATAVAYGVLVLVASLPGVAVLALGWIRGGKHG